MADLDYNSLSNHLFRPENIEAMMLPIVEAENNAAETAVSSPIPDELPILPLRGVVVYPLTAVPLTVGQPRSIQLIDDAVLNKKVIGLVASRDPSVEEPTPDQCYTIGTAVMVQRLLRLVLPKRKKT